MNTGRLCKSIDDALTELKNYASSHQAGLTAVDDAIQVLNLLKEEIIRSPGRINKRVLSAMHDIGMSSYKDFENTNIEEAINKITEQLHNEVPVYKTLQPLRGEFGKGYPI